MKKISRRSFFGRLAALGTVVWLNPLKFLEKPTVKGGKPKRRLKFRRYHPLPPSTSPLVEGITPTGHQLKWKKYGCSEK